MRPLAGHPLIAYTIAAAREAGVFDAVVVSTDGERTAEIARHYGAEVPGLRVFGPPSGEDRGGIVSFDVEGVHAHDVSEILDRHGVAVRAGHHCARPVCVRYGIPATTRASFGVYTTMDEVDALVRGLGQVKEVFG